MSILEKLRKAFGPGNEPAKVDAARQEKLASLTDREYEAYSILIEGYTLKFCAEKMGIKYSTANTYQNAIYKKLDVKTRAKLIIEYKDLRCNPQEMQ